MWWPKPQRVNVDVERLQGIRFKFPSCSHGVPWPSAVRKANSPRSLGSGNHLVNFSKGWVFMKVQTLCRAGRKKHCCLQRRLVHMVPSVRCPGEAPRPYCAVRQDVNVQSRLQCCLPQGCQQDERGDAAQQLLQPVAAADRVDNVEILIRWDLHRKIQRLRSFGNGFCSIVKMVLACVQHKVPVVIAILFGQIAWSQTSCSRCWRPACISKRITCSTITTTTRS